MKNRGINNPLGNNMLKLTVKTFWLLAASAFLTACGGGGDPDMDVAADALQMRGGAVMPHASVAEITTETVALLMTTRETTNTQ